jgi:hypothetical protein
MNKGWHPTAAYTERKSNTKKIKEEYNDNTYADLLLWFLGVER